MVVDPVGGDAAEPALRSLGFGGRYLVVGFASGHIPRLPANQVLLRNRSVMGVEWASWITANPDNLARTMEVVLNRLARGVLHPPCPHLVTLDDLPDVLLGAPPPSGLVRTVTLPGGVGQAGVATGGSALNHTSATVRTSS
jgi:NADPH2:quinone reductase